MTNNKDTTIVKPVVAAAVVGAVIGAIAVGAALSQNEEIKKTTLDQMSKAKEAVSEKIAEGKDKAEKVKETINS